MTDGTTTGIDVQSMVLAVLTIALGVVAFLLTTAWVLPILITLGGVCALFVARQ
ncbi:hypothetical protein [Streptomyces sp. NBC_00503]|uniref:hypothetical protein n=1 Tax=Streptomyces sp. NBC_00503 TaxID=2903659 RepID=UPI002E8194D6|nr:hypothetical protein [Streptomyces sp. NBC_00503]WUD84664.1 hypothetical protein OG490_31175 [Streptomyces sp. NBC_00503]